MGGVIGPAEIERMKKDKNDKKKEDWKSEYIFYFIFFIFSKG